MLLSDEVYLLPPEIGAALLSDRAELITIYVNRMKDVDREKAEMARLISDLLGDRRHLRSDVKQLKCILESVKNHSIDAENNIQHALKLIAQSGIPESLYYRD